MKFERSAGILLHPTSLPGKYAIGDLGDDAFKFVDFLEKSGQKLWQVFPLGPTGYGDSPYQCFSAFAGNPNLVSPDKLKEDGLLRDHDLQNIPEHDQTSIDYGEVIEYKKSLLKKAFTNYKRHQEKFEKDFNKFSKENSAWLDDFAFFMAAKEAHGGIVWKDWDEGLVLRKKKALDEWKKKLEDDILYQKFVQFIFFKQWRPNKGLCKRQRNKNNWGYAHIYSLR